MAIAFDNATFSAESAGTSKTFAHTVGAGADRVLVVIAHNNSSATNSFTGATYNGVAMTRLTGVASANGDMYDNVYVLVNPASGANNVVISSSGSIGIIGMASSYTGVNQSNPTVFSAISSAISSTSVSNAVTTTVDNSWIVASGAQNAVQITASTNINNVRASESPTAYRRIADSGAITPAGSTNQTWTYASNCCILCQVVLEPTGGGGGGAGASRMSLLGVGS